MSADMSMRFGKNTLLKKFAGVFAHNSDIERFDALVGYLRLRVILRFSHISKTFHIYKFVLELMWMNS